MAKLTTTTQEIQYTLQQQQKEYLNEKEKREIKKDYLSFLKATIKEDLQYYYIKNNNYLHIYNYLVSNCDKIINDIIKEMREESQKRYKEVSTFKKLKNGNFKDEKKMIYLWDNFDIENDISENYFKILKQINEEYKLKNKIGIEYTTKILENYFADLYKKYPYNAVNSILYQNGQDEIVANEITTNEQMKKIILEYYYKILNKIDSIYKKVKTQKNQEINQNKIKTSTFLIGGFAAGVCSGIKKSIK